MVLLLRESLLHFLIDILTQEAILSGEYCFGMASDYVEGFAWESGNCLLVLHFYIRLRRSLLVTR